MADTPVTLVDHSGNAVATARVSPRGDGIYVGSVDLGPMPPALRRSFEEFEELVNGQVFSLLDEVVESLGRNPLRVVFAEGHEARAEDLQIFPRTGRLSFRVSTDARPTPSPLTASRPSRPAPT